MLTPGDVVELDLGMPAGGEAGLRRPAVVVTAQRILGGGPNVVQVVPLTRAVRRHWAGRGFGWQNMVAAPEDDPREEPAPTRGERATLTSYLKFQRQTLEMT